MVDYDDELLREIRQLRNDIENSRVILEGEKESFRRKLIGGMGNDITDELNNPRKYSFLTALKVRWARWVKIRKERKLRRKQEGGRG